MSAVKDKNRELLFDMISSSLSQWPEIDRRVFFQAHYYGKSPEAISRSVRLDVDQVSTILKQCDLRLHASLRNFRKGGLDPRTALPAA